jgi:hypothetical protein
MAKGKLTLQIRRAFAALLLALACESSPGAEDGIGAASGGIGAASGGWACQGPVYLRVRNASELDFDSVEVAGIAFGALKHGSLSDYQPATGCDSLVAARATRGGQIFSRMPFDSLAPPLTPGRYTCELTTEPSANYENGAGFRGHLSKDPPPK